MDHGTRPARQARAQRHERQSRVHICFPRSPRLGAWPKSPPCTRPREGGTERLGSVSRGEAGDHSRAGRVQCPLFLCRSEGVLAEGGGE